MYGYYFDTQRWAEIIDLFSDNAKSVEIVDHGVFYGKKGVETVYMDVIGGRGRGPSPGWIKFVVMQIGAVIDVAPDGLTAKGRWQTWLCESKPYGAFPRQEWLHGYYENKYVKENGKWKYLNFCGRSLDREKFEEFKTRFYKFQGWDPATGWPTRSNLESIGLGCIADELEQSGRLG